MKRLFPAWLRNAGVAVFAALYDRLEASSRERTYNRLIRSGILQVGVGTYGTPRIHDLRGKTPSRIVIGNYCSIGPGVVLMLGGEHRSDFVSSFPFNNFLDGQLPNQDAQPFTRGDIVIGHDVWIGHGAFISSGVTIGTGAVVGAGSVVRQSVAPYEIVRGNPSRPLRKRFSDAHIEALLATQWWDWPVDKIRENLDLISSPNIADFLERHRR